MCNRPDLPVAVVLALQARDTGRFYTVRELATNQTICKYPGMVGLTSGKLKPGESWTQAMIREVGEEGGFVLRPTQVRVLSQSHQFSQHPVPVTIGHALIDHEREGVSIDPEVCPNGWLSEEELRALRWQDHATRVETHVALSAVRAAWGVLA